MSNLPKDFSDLPRDLAEEVLFKVVPVTSLRRVRSTCKKWNTLTRCRSFKKKHLGVQAKLAAKKREFMVVMMMDFRVYLMSVNLHNKVELCIERQGTLIFPNASDQILVRQVFHCEGLLLCILKDNPRIVVFNPYCGGQPRWIEATYSSYHRWQNFCYALGYNNSTKSHKILSLFSADDHDGPEVVEFKIYDFNSCDSSWRLAVLFQREDSLQMEIWVTTKIGPNSVSWSSKFFLSVNTKVLTAVDDEFMFSYMASHFFIDEVKKVVVVFDRGKDSRMMRYTAYIIGQDESFKEVNLGESLDKFCAPFVCSYVPSAMQLE
ncbi:PREDICTED: putative F-box protein At3g23420 [Camelina sativa]|uniref:F-box protein At3g23420 n=1 Tax=Camelina sativa TaxID=90675 RepID=A0ABM1RJC6_CAMSA|nr:PREDICTED: putative F-box protein At3g23420 [Camelina sativa]